MLHGESSPTIVLPSPKSDLNCRIVVFVDDVDTVEYGCSEDTTQSDSPPEPESRENVNDEDDDDDPLLQDEEGEQDTMSAGEPQAGPPPLQNHINTSVLNQLKQKFEEVPESIVIKVLKEVSFVSDY